MSELGLGTLQAGDRSFFRNTDPNEYRKVLRAALKRGISHFDTAYTYREAETLLGALIKESKRDRETIYLTDKIMPVPTLERKAETALKRLGTEYIDTLLYDMQADIAGVGSSYIDPMTDYFNQMLTSAGCV